MPLRPAIVAAVFVVSFSATPQLAEFPAKAASPGCFADRFAISAILAAWRRQSLPAARQCRHSVDIQPASLYLIVPVNGQDQNLDLRRWRISRCDLSPVPFD